MPSWKGKERQVVARDDGIEGDGGADGIVLALDQVGSGIYDVAYTIPIKFGDTQQFSLQVDTGSSDLWIASKSCSTSSCGLTSGRLYDPSAARQTGQDFTIPYLQGSASGPIVWDKVSLGGYTIDNQALAAANDVQSEPLAPNFSGILGLALPLNSIIAEEIPPVTNNDPDGAAWASNLFSLTPVSDAPAARFLSLSLARPGSDAVPSLLGIGHHPSALVPDPSKIQYSTLVSEQSGTLFWKANVRAITVYVNSVPKPVSLGRSVSGAAFPSAVLDSGVPLILTTSTVANAIYGALGVTPASDGTYYVPCSTPLNLTITLDNRPEIPIHPLDVTAEPPDNNQAQFCIGLIQPADNVLTHDSAIGDMVLGVPFLRNTYTVMAYTPPNSDGSFSPLTTTTTTSSSASTTSISSNDEDNNDNNNKSTSRVSTKVTPMLGILPLTDPTRALQEFNTVRILNQPLSSSTPAPNTGSNANTKTVDVGGKKLSVGIVVLIGLLSFFALCCALFLIRWLLFRRKFRKGRKGILSESDELDQKTAYRLARRTSLGALGAAPLAGVAGENLTEDELRELRYRSYVRKNGKGLSESTVGSDRTLRVDHPDKDVDGYFGYIKQRRSGDNDDDDDWDPHTNAVWGGNNTLVAGRKSAASSGDEPHHEDEHPASAEVRPLVGSTSPPSSPDQPTFPHARTYSDPEPALAPTPRLQTHANSPSVQLPLLGLASRSRTQSYDDTEEAIVSTHARLFSADSADPNNIILQPLPPAALKVPQEPARQDSNVLDFGEFGAPSALNDDDVDGGVRTSMAGIGSASRGARFGAFGVRPTIDSLPFNRESLMSISSAGTVVGQGIALGSPSEQREQSRDSS